MNRTDWIHSVLNAVDPDLAEEASAPRRRRPRLRPALLAAACLCLLLLGTALASEGFTAFPSFRVIQEHTRDGRLRTYRSGWEVVVETRPIPLSSFSRQARAIPQDTQATTLGSDYVMEGFDSLQEAEDFLGLELVDNPMLDAAEPFIGFSIGQEDGSSLPVYALLTRYWSEEDALRSVSLSAALRLTGEDGSETTLHVTVSLRTEAADQAGEVVTTSLNRPGSTYRTEEYTTASGLMAVLVEAAEPWGEETRVDYIASFSHRGAAFRIQAFCPDDPQSALDTLKQILNAFE